MKYIKLKRFVKKKRPKRRKSRQTKGPKLSADKLKNWSLFVRERDNYTCRSCSSTKNIHAHHIVSKYYRPQHAYKIKNGVSLCKRCHLGKQGIHGKGKPKNNFIKLLRSIYYNNDIVKACMLNA